MQENGGTVMVLATAGKVAPGSCSCGNWRTMCRYVGLIIGALALRRRTRTETMAAMLTRRRTFTYVL